MGSESHDTSRRTILKGSALGAGALLGAAALPATAHAVTPAKPSSVGSADGPDGYFLTVKSDTIELNSFSFGVARGASEGRATGKEGRPAQFHFTAPATVASPTLMLLTVSGQELPAVQFTAKDANQVTFLKINLAEVLVSSYEMSGPSDDIPTDSGTLSYGKISYSYYPVTVAGGPGTPNTMTWNVRTDKWAT
jgi:type VI protein secretion system component Hcp